MVQIPRSIYGRPQTTLVPDLGRYQSYRETSYPKFWRGILTFENRYQIQSAGQFCGPGLNEKPRR